MNQISETIRILIFQPGKRGELVSIPNELLAMQQIVSGHIEMVWLDIDHELAIICNDDGLRLGLTENRRVGITGIVGAFFIARVQGSELASLTTEDEWILRERFDFVRH